MKSFNASYRLSWTVSACLTLLLLLPTVSHAAPAPPANDLAGGLGMLIVLGTLYLVPTLVARVREHHQALAITVLNVVAGWTVLGWVGALGWACTVVHRPAAASLAPPVAVPLPRPQGLPVLPADQRRRPRPAPAPRPDRAANFTGRFAKYGR